MTAVLRLGLLTSERDRRAMDETFADWAFERQEASGPLRRLVVDVRGAAAVTAALLRVAGAEAGQRASWRPVAVASLLAAAFTLISFTWSTPRVFSAGLAPAHAALLSAALIPSGMTVCFAPMLAALLLRQRVPVLGTTIAAVTAMIAMVGWITPESNQWYRQTSFALWTPSEAGRPIPRGTGELTLTDLVAGATGLRPELAHAAPRQLLLRTGFIAWAPAACLLACCVRPFIDRGNRRHWARILLPVAIFATIPAATGLRAVIGAPFEIVTWMAVLLTLLASVPWAMAMRPRPASD